VTSKLGLKQLRKSVGINTGLAAALGFLATGLILFFGFGWEVGRGIPGMLTVLLICSIGGTLIGGMAMGWILEKLRTGLLHNDQPQ
jgi:4-hydroxybenzoate polyprenyltransferase